MKRRSVFLAAMFALAVGPAFAMWSIADRGTWPESWPAELEPLRKQARSMTGGLANLTHYEIPFTRQDSFESSWPHVLRLKSPGAPIFLVRGPSEHIGKVMTAGVRIYCPPILAEGSKVPAEPLPGNRSARERWLWTTFIELVVDGEVVDLNRIPIPADTPIIDERFQSDEGHPRDEPNE